MVQFFLIRTVVVACLACGLPWLSKGLETVAKCNYSTGRHWQLALYIPYAGRRRTNSNPTHLSTCIWKKVPCKLMPLEAK